MTPGRGGAVVQGALFVAAMALAAFALWPVYSSGAFVAAAAGAIGAGAVVAAVGAWRRWPSIVLLAATVVAFTVLGVPLAVPGRALGGVLPTLDGLAELYASVALGWRRLLTITLPVGSYEALLVPAFTLLLVAAVVGLSVTLRARRGGLGMLAPVAVFLVGIAFGPDAAYWPAAVTLALLGVVLAALIHRRWSERRAAIRALADRAVTPSTPERGPAVGARAIAAAAVLVVVAGTGSVAAAAVLPPTGARDVLRTATTQPFDPRSYPSPLSAFRSWLRAPTASAPLLTVSGLPDGGRIRIATVDDYDGVVYGVGGGSGTFTRVPTRLDAGEGDEVSLEVRVDGYRGVWVPGTGSPASFDFSGDRADRLASGLYLDRETGTAADLAGLVEGDAYRLDAVIADEPDRSRLADLTPGDARVPAPAIVPDELRTRLEEYTQEARQPGARLAAALDGLARDGYISHGLDADEPPSRAGHSADRIAQLFTDQRMIGDGEQYAVAAALMATELGFPARVVVGFAPDAGAADTVRITGGDIAAWIEVDTAESGWVTLDPTPEDRPIPDEEPEDPTRISRPLTVLPPPADAREEPETQTPPPAGQQDLPDDDGVLAVVLAVVRVAGWVLLVAGLVSAPFLAVIGAQVRRRRRRRAAEDPRDRIRGGWEEFSDAALDHGYRLTPALTRSQVAETVGGVRSRRLAQVADRAVFAPEQPTAAEGDSVWKAVDELGRQMDERLSRRGRLRAALSLRSLRRTRVDAEGDAR